MSESTRRRSVRLGLKSKGTPLINEQVASVAVANEHVTASVGKSSRRKSKAPQVAEVNANGVRSRRSDLISWEDGTPCQPDRVKAASNLDTMEEENEAPPSEVQQAAPALKANLFDWFSTSSTPSSPALSKAAHKKKSLENKENADDLDDFLCMDEGAPMKIGYDSSKNGAATLQAKNLNSSAGVGTPTNYRRSLAAGRTSMSTNTNVINSPLLKIALISSHGKRLSTSNLQ